MKEPLLYLARKLLFPAEDLTVGVEIVSDVCIDGKQVLEIGSFHRNQYQANTRGGCGMSGKVVLLGPTSFTGSHLLSQLSDDYDFLTVGRDANKSDIALDVTQNSITDIASELSQATYVINCFSDGNVDSCELNSALSRTLNHTVPSALCDLQKKHDFHLVHLSSNAVYDGETPLYSETSNHKPVNKYGELKSEADCYLLENSPKCTILRPITMYGQLLGDQRHNPFSFFFSKLWKNEDITAVNDVFVNMLHIDQLISCLEVVLRDGVQGEFNIAGKDIVNRADFVKAIKSRLPDCTSNVHETDSTGFSTPARRPRDTSFDTSKMQQVLGVTPAPLLQTIEKLVERAVQQQTDPYNAQAA